MYIVRQKNQLTSPLLKKNFEVKGIIEGRWGSSVLLCLIGILGESIINAFYLYYIRYLTFAVCLGTRIPPAANPAGFHICIECRGEDYVY